jgi:hypothetical protein
MEEQMSALITQVAKEREAITQLAADVKLREAE